MRNMDIIYREYMPQVYKYLFSLCHDAHLAEELTQETFFRALKSIKDFRGDCKLYVWLCQIAKFIWMQELTRQKKARRIQFTDQIVAAEKQPDEVVVQKEEKMDLFKSLHTLQEPMREVMYLRLSGEFSFKEIGEILGKDENWARVTFYRGKQMVRRMSK